MPGHKVSHLVDVSFSGSLGGKPSATGPKGSRLGTDPRYCLSGEAGCSETQQGAIRRPPGAWRRGSGSSRAPVQARSCRTSPSRRPAGFDLLRGRGDDPGYLPHTHRPTRAAGTSRSDFHPRDSGTVQPSEASHPILHRPPLLYKEIRR